MTSVSWRRLLLGLCAFALVQFAADCWMQATAYAGMPDVSAAVPTAVVAPDGGRITFPDSSPLTRTGLRSGDVLDISALSPSERWRWYSAWWWPGERITFVVRRGSASLRVPVTAESQTLPWFAWVGSVGVAWGLLFASIVAWRRADNPEARALVLLFVLTDIGLGWQPQNWITPWPLVDFSCNLVSYGFSAAGLMMLPLYASLFARPLSKLRRSLTVAAYLAAGLAAAANITRDLARWNGDHVPLHIGSELARILFGGVPYVLAGLCAVAAIVPARGVERTRLVWVALPAATLVFFQATSPLVPLALADAYTVALNVGLFVLPLVMTYSLLSRRVLDAGFALNRAAVFAATSLLLAGAFTALQWAANTLVTGLVHSHNLAIDLAIVLIVYYVVRVSRSGTERFVTRVFFAARERRLRALREVRPMVDQVADPAAIAPLVVGYLRTQVEIAACVFFENGAGDYEPAAGCAPDTPPIRRDDVVLIQLKTRREPMRAPEWHHLGAVVFPMLVRGHLRGMLFAQRPDDGDFAPDEMRALEALAIGIATDRDDLLATSLRAELDELRAQMFDLRAQLGVRG